MGGIYLIVCLVFGFFLVKYLCFNIFFVFGFFFGLYLNMFFNSLYVIGVIIFLYFFLNWFVIFIVGFSSLNYGIFIIFGYFDFVGVFSIECILFS